jgi:hypothetical protein
LVDAIVKLDTVVKVVDVADKVLRAGIAIFEAKKKREEDEKDRKIRELEAENKRLKEGK